MLILDEIRTLSCSSTAFLSHERRHPDRGESVNCQSRRHRSIESIISSAGCIAGNTFALGRMCYSPVFILQGTLIPRKLSTELRIDHSHAKLIAPNVLPFSCALCRSFLHAWETSLSSEKRQASVSAKGFEDGTAYACRHS